MDHNDGSPRGGFGLAAGWLAGAGAENANSLRLQLTHLSKKVGGEEVRVALLGAVNHREVGAPSLFAFFF